MPKATPEKDHIAEAAYFLWLEEGRPEGRAADHWARATAALTAPAPRKRAAAKSTPAKTTAAKSAKPRTRKATKGSA